MMHVIGARQAWVAVLVGAMALGVHGQSADSPAPRLACDAVNGQDIRPGQSIAVSNLSRISMRATLLAPVATDELRLESSAGPDGTVLPATLEIVAARVPDAAGTPPPTINARVSGSGTELGAQYLSVSMEIPIHAAIRRQHVERYLDRMEQESLKTGLAAPFKRLTQDRPAVIAMLERLHMENAVGDFEVRCRYSSRRPGFWSGDVVSSPPLRLHIVFDGNFFDQQAFR